MRRSVRLKFREIAAENLLESLIAVLLSGTPGWTRTTGQWLKRTVFAPEYQSLTGSSDVRVTIFCPGLSRNADFGNITTRTTLGSKVREDESKNPY